MIIKMIGHSTLLITIGDFKIITDPYFGESGNSMYKRMTPYYGEIEDYAKCDLVLLSHEHWDHIDKNFFSKLSSNIQVIMPNSLYSIRKIIGIKNGKGLKNYESINIQDIKITAVPAKHMALCCGYIIEHKGECIYFAGDTFYNKFMNNIGEKFNIDIALMPVTTFRTPMTMSEKSAVLAAVALKPKVIIPIHLGIQPRCFVFRTKDSVEGFTNRIKQSKINSKVIKLDNGQEFKL